MWKLPHFEVVLNHECQSKWKSYYKDYREEMSNAMNIQDRDLKNDATEQVKRKYKRVIISVSLLNQKSIIKVSFHFPAISNWYIFLFTFSCFMVLRIWKIVQGTLWTYTMKLLLSITSVMTMP